MDGMVSEINLVNKLEVAGIRINRNEKRFFIPYNVKRTVTMEVLVNKYGWKGQYSIE